MSFFCLALVLFTVVNRINVRTTPNFEAIFDKESMQLLSYIYLKLFKNPIYYL